jgi:hypothetical protein
MVLGGLEEEEPSNRSDLVLLHNVESSAGRYAVYQPLRSLQELPRPGS